MDSDSTRKIEELKPSFRKPANRKYRRRGSPLSSPDGSPKQSDHGPSKDLTKDTDNFRKGGRDLDMDSARDRSEKNQSYRHSERDYYGSSRDRKRDDYDKHHKQKGNENSYDRSRDYSRTSDKHSLDSDRSLSIKDRERESTDVEKERHKEKDSFSSRDAPSRKHGSSNVDGIQSREAEKRDIERPGRDYKRDSRKPSGDYKEEHSSVFRESRMHGKDSDTKSSSEGFRRYGNDSSKDREFEKPKEWYARNEKDYGTSKYKESYGKSSYSKERSVSPGKRRKFFDSDKVTDYVKDEKDFSSSTMDELPPSSSTKHTVTADKVISGPADLSFNNIEAAHDFNAAKVAAMKAAELVNRNLVGGGYMSTDQKKKLLWGSKKSTAAVEEPGHRWDSTLFPDKERQEKFNKLMSLRLPWYLWPLVGCERRCERWRDCPPRREAGATPDGSRKAVHCWTSSKRWPHSRAWSVNTVYSPFTFFTSLLDNVRFLYSVMCKNVLV